LQRGKVQQNQSAAVVAAIENERDFVPLDCGGMIKQHPALFVVP